MTKCIICFQEHNRMWHDLPNMYCEKCWPIRDGIRGTRSHIIGSIYLGDMIAAGRFGEQCLCVHEAGVNYEGPHYQVSILESKPRLSWDRTGALASIGKLEEASNIIENYFRRGENLLVHCHGGVERSPLTVAYWLTTRGYLLDINTAYAFLKMQRPVVSPRLFWMPKDHEFYQEMP